MRNRAATAFLLGACIAVIPARTIESQGIGGMIKKKAADAVKGKDTKKDQATEAAKDDTPRKSIFGDCGPMGPDMAFRFLEGLRAEQEARDAWQSGTQFRRPAQEVVACREGELNSPTYQKYMNQGFEKNPPSTPAALEKQMAKNTADFSAYVDKKCGKDPSTFNEREAYNQAHRDGAKAAGISEKCYDALFEPILAFCMLTPENQKAAAAYGLELDVVGVPENWGYTASEAKAIAPYCKDYVDRIQRLGYKVAVRQ